MEKKINPVLFTQLILTQLISDSCIIHTFLAPFAILSSWVNSSTLCWWSRYDTQYMTSLSLRVLPIRDSSSLPIRPSVSSESSKEQEKNASVWGRIMTFTDKRFEPIKNSGQSYQVILCVSSQFSSSVRYFCRMVFLIKLWIFQNPSCDDANG